VDAKAKALKAAGRPVVSFAAGEPDFPTPANVVEAAQAACADPKNHRYSPGAGLPELREAIAQATLRTDGTEIDPSQVLVTNGGKQSVYETFATVLDPGDEVILPAPYWTTYPEAIRLAGAVPVEVFAGADQAYVPTIEHGIWVLSDEIYQNLTYDGVPFTSILKAVPELADTTVLMNGVAKTYAMTGWRVGWTVGPKDVISAASSLQSHLTSNVANVSQRAALEALSGPQDAVVSMREAFDRRRKLIVEALSGIDGFRVPTPQGAFYAFPDVTAVLGRKIGSTEVTSSTELATTILEQVEVAAVPGEAFGAPGHLRFSYALSDGDITEGIGRVARLLNA
jgi:aspartate/methionine/tyrosine aminotransferase